jgi:hypothetical protein
MVKQTLHAKDTELKDLQQQKSKLRFLKRTVRELDEKDRLIDHLRSEVTTKERELEDAVAQKDALDKNKKAQDNEYTEDMFKREKRIGQFKEDLETKAARHAG